MRNRTWTDEQMIEAVRTSFSIAEVLRKIGLEDKNAGSNYYTVKEATSRLALDTSHFLGRGHLRGKLGTSSHPLYSLDEILIEDSPYCLSATSGLKRRLIREGVLENRCYACPQGTEWNGKSLVLVLDHISGVKSDNRRENLRLLCPNCNSQQDTFTGRNSKINRFRRSSRVCLECGGRVSNSSKTGLCCRCAPKLRRKLELGSRERHCACGAMITNGSKSGLCVSCIRRESRKSERPPLDVILREVGETSFLAVGRKYGVSDNAVRKWIKHYEIKQA
jgi:hypothetical protein